MSSRFAALVARASLFALEALEPRRFLSAAGDVQPVSFDISSGAELQGSIEPGQKVVLEFQATAGKRYLIVNNSWQTRVSIVDPHNDSVESQQAWEEQIIVLDAAESGPRQVLVEQAYQRDDEQFDYHVYARIYQDDYADAMQDAQPLTEDSSLKGHVDGAADVDWFSFEAEPGAVYRVDANYVDIGGFNASLYGSDGEPIANPSYYDHELILRPSEGGRYYVKVSQQKDASIADLYSLSLHVIRDDAPDEIEAAAPWDLSTTLSGALDYAGDNDYFRFDARAGQTFIFDAIQGLSTSIYDSDGTGYLAQIPDLRSDDEIQGQLVWTAPHDGTYYVAITAWSAYMAFTPEGEYAIRATPLVDGGMVGTLLPGETAQGSFDQPGEMDHFQFDAVEGKLYEFHVSGEAGKAYIVTIDGPPSTSESHPGGNVYATPIFGDLYLTDVAAWVAPESGRFEVSVVPLDSTWIGTYTLAMSETADDVGNDGAHATPLPLNQPREGSLEYADDKDVFSIDVVAGHRYAISLVVDQTPADWYQIWLGWDWQSSLNWLDSVSHWGAAIGPQQSFLEATETGTLPFWVGGDHSVPRYMVEVVDITSPSPAEESVPLTIDEPVTVDFEGTGRLHYLRIDVQAGVTYRLTVAPGPSDVGLVLQTNDGQLNTWFSYAQRVKEGDDLQWVWAPDESGTYYVALANVDPRWVGQYTVSLEMAADPTGEFWAKRNLNVGEPIAGTTESARQHENYFRFAGEAGVTYQITLKATGYSSRLQLIGHDGVSVEDEAEQEVISDGKYNRELTLTFKADSSSPYFILVQKAGLYVLSAEMAPEPVPPPLPVPPPATDDLIAAMPVELKDENAHNLFAFHAVAGRTYRFRTVLVTLDDSVIGLFDPATQRVIAFNDDTDDPALWDDDVQWTSSQVIWTAETSGDVYVIAWGYDDQWPARYRLEVYSSAAKDGETLEPLSVAAARGEEMVGAVDDALFKAEMDESAGYWDDLNNSQDGWDDSDWLDSDVWNDGEDW